MQKREKLSLLMDGEDIIVDSVLDEQLLADRSLQLPWQCYHLIRDTLQGNLSQNLPVDFAARVAHALQRDSQQPAYQGVLSGLRVYQAAWQRCWSGAAASMRQLGEISLAAGIAGLLLYGAHWYQGATESAHRYHPSFNPLPLGGETLPVGYPLFRQPPRQQQALRRQWLHDKVNDYDSLLRLQQPQQAMAKPAAQEPNGTTP